MVATNRVEATASVKVAMTSSSSSRAAVASGNSQMKLPLHPWQRASTHSALGAGGIEGRVFCV